MERDKWDESHTEKPLREQESPPPLPKPESPPLTLRALIAKSISRTILLMTLVFIAGLFGEKSLPDLIRTILWLSPFGLIMMAVFTIIDRLSSD